MLCALLIVPTPGPLMIVQRLWHRDIQLNLPLSQLVRGCAATDGVMRRCTALSLIWNIPSSVQTHQASSIHLPLSSVLHSFAKLWFVSLWCILLIASMSSGVSLGYLHSAAGEAGEIPSTDAAIPQWMLLLGYFSCFHCCYLLLWLTWMRQYYHLIHNILSCPGLEHWLALQTQIVLGLIPAFLQLLISDS